MANENTFIWNHEVESDTYTQYTIRYYDKQLSVLISSDPNEVANWIILTERIHGVHLDRSNYPVIGIEVIDWLEFFHYPPTDYSLQICVGDRCLIYPLNFNELPYYIPPELFNFLDNSDFTFITLSDKKECIQLMREYFGGIDFGKHHNVLELGELIGIWDRIPTVDITNLNKLANIVLDKATFPVTWLKTMTEDVRVDPPDFTQAHILFSSVNVYVIFEIGMMLYQNCRERYNHATLLAVIRYL